MTGSHLTYTCFSSQNAVKFKLSSFGFLNAIIVNNTVLVVIMNGVFEPPYNVFCAEIK